MALKNITIRDLIMVVVVTVWSVAALASILTSNTVPLGIITPVMMVVVGFLFRAYNGNGSGDKQ